ncbi:MAG TPA: hypothetical protein VF952_00725 [Chloroflexia bacterium]
MVLVRVDWTNVEESLREWAAGRDTQGVQGFQLAWLARFRREIEDIVSSLAAAGRLDPQLSRGHLAAATALLMYGAVDKGYPPDHTWERLANTLTKTKVVNSADRSLEVVLAWGAGWGDKWGREIKRNGGWEDQWPGAVSALLGLTSQTAFRALKAYQALRLPSRVGARVSRVLDEEQRDTVLDWAEFIWWDFVSGKCTCTSRIRRATVRRQADSVDPPMQLCGIREHQLANWDPEDQPLSEFLEFAVAGTLLGGLREVNTKRGMLYPYLKDK